MTPTLYGISNCDTVKKAKRWLDDAAIAYQFHDFRADGIDEDTLSNWISRAGWEAVVNRRSTSWRALDDATKDTMNDANAVAALLATPTLVKRPVLVTNQALEFGFKAERYRELLS